MAEALQEWGMKIDCDTAIEALKKDMEVVEAEKT